jgi:pyruvate kinase
MIIRTKIIATVGPASGTVETITDLIRAGCDVFRINFSHGSNEQRLGFIRAIRQAEEQTGEPIAICADLCGPKIRVGPLPEGGVLLKPDQTLTIQRQPTIGSVDRISTTLGELVDDVRPGQSLLLDDGKLRLEVIETCPPDEVLTRVIVGGTLTSGKGVNLPDTLLSLSALTEKDRRDAEWLAGEDFDYVALSFVQRPGDIHELRKLLNANGCDAHIIAKIEKPQAVDHFTDILRVTDGVMVARGDLGVEMDFPAVPVTQKRITAAAQRAGKPCIIATQMLESMIHSPTPTRAEVSDVANAVLDHADAVMLSGETAVGEYPVQVVRTMDATVKAAQTWQDEDEKDGRWQVTSESSPTTAAVAGAVRSIMQAEDIKAVAVFTETGKTARMLAKNRPPCPILAFSPDLRAVRRMCLYYGVNPLQTDVPTHTREVLTLAAEQAKTLGIASEGDRIVVLTGRPMGQAGQTNTLVVHTIGQEQV